MFKTHSVSFRIPGGYIANEYGQEKPTFTTEVVDGCLFSQLSSDDLQFPNLSLDKTTIRIDIPKTFTKSLSNAELILENTNSFLDGRKFKVVGNPVGFMPENVPGRWNRWIFAEEIA